MAPSSVNIDPNIRKVLVLGGARSGKSDFALAEVEKAGERRVYIATATALDSEMAERISLHQEGRGEGWETIEEPVEIEAALRAISGKAVLIDCLTLYLMNLVEAGLTDSEIVERATKLNLAVASFEGTVVVVSNELGLGLVPEGALSRRFRDLSGRINQLVAAEMDEVFFVAAGLPLKIK